MEKVSPTDNPRHRERPGSAGEMYPSVLQPYSLTNCLCLFVHNTPPHQALTRVRKSAADSQKGQLPGGKESSQSCTPDLPQEHARSPWGAAPASTPVALPTDAVPLPSHCSIPQVRAVDTELSYCDSASSVSHDSQPLPGLPGAWSPAKNGLQHLQEGDICLALLSLTSAPWLLFSSQQIIPLQGNAQDCLLFRFIFHSSGKAFPPFTSPFVLAQAQPVAILCWILQCRHFLKRQRPCNSQQSFLASIYVR